MIIRDRRAITALWFAIWLLIVVGLSTSVVATIEELRPEIVLETCSLLAALFLVIVERLATRNAVRSAALNRIVEELHANAEILCSGVWAMDIDMLLKELAEHRSGFRFYYTHLSITAVSQAILGTTFNVISDVDLIGRLQEWRTAAEQCNSRLGMGQRFLFFLPSTEDGMFERLDVHYSIAEVPAVDAREALRELAEYLLGLSARGNAPSETTAKLEAIIGLVTDNALVATSLAALNELHEQTA